MLTRNGTAEGRSLIQLGKDDCGYMDDNDLSIIKTCAYYMEGICMVLFGGFGLTGNLVSCFVFLRQRMLSHFNCLLIVLAFFDSLFIIFSIFHFSIARVFEWPFPEDSEVWLYLIPKGIHPFSNICMCCSNFMTILIAWERYRAVCFPSHFRMSNSVVSPLRILGHTVPVVGFSVLINLPKFFETEYYYTERMTNGTDHGAVSKLNIRWTEMKNDPNYILYYTFWTRLIVTGVIPFVLLAFFNVNIFKGIRETKERLARKPSGRENQYSLFRKRQTKNELNLAVILIFIAMLWVVCNLPRLILNCTEYFLLNKMIRCQDQLVLPTWFDCLTSLNHLFLVINSSLNICVYYTLSSSFRKSIQQYTQCVASQRMMTSAVEQRLSQRTTKLNPAVAETTL